MQWGPLTSVETLSGPSLLQLSSPPQELHLSQPQRPGTLHGLHPAGKDLLCRPDLQCLFPLGGDQKVQVISLIQITKQKSDHGFKAVLCSILIVLN